MTVIMEVPSTADWRSDQIADDPGWRLPLSDAHQAEVLAALTVAQAAGVRIDKVSREVFPLPTLGPQLTSQLPLASGPDRPPTCCRTANASSDKSWIDTPGSATFAHRL